MTDFETWSLILNTALIVIGIVTVWVVIMIYRLQRKDERQKRRLEIKPILECGGGGSGSGSNEFSSNFKFLYNDAKCVSIEIIDESKVSLFKFKNMLVRTNQYFTVKGINKLKGVPLENIEYDYFISFTDRDGNRYKSHIRAKGVGTNIEETIEF